MSAPTYAKAIGFVIYVAFEYFLGNSTTVKSNSTVELIINMLRSLRSKKKE